MLIMFSVSHSIVSSLIFHSLTTCCFTGDMLFWEPQSHFFKKFFIEIFIEVMGIHMQLSEIIYRLPKHTLPSFSKKHLQNYGIILHQDNNNLLIFRFPQFYLNSFMYVYVFSSVQFYHLCRSVCPLSYLRH